MNLDNTPSLNNSQENTTVYETIAKLSFVIFLFFSVFGTSLPFKDKITFMDEIATSNIVNQAVYSLLFLTSCFTLTNKRSELFLLIKG